MAKRTGGCTKSGNNYVRWYRGKTRYVCPASTPAGEVEDAWEARRKAIDAGAAVVVPRRPGGRLLLKELLSLFFDECERRVSTGKPRPMSPRTLHNYTADLNEFGEVVGSATALADIGPDQFAAYSQKIGHLKMSGYASKVAHVARLFHWAVRMEYVDRVRFGELARPAKRDIRDQRIPRRRSFTPKEVARLLDGANATMQAMIGLGIAGAMTNSEVAHLERSCVDLKAGVIDFRRRKTGKVRRVIPLPREVVVMLKVYQRPEPVDPADDGLFFLTEDGKPYVRMTKGGQANTITVLFNRLSVDCKVRNPALPPDGRSFAGLRTTFYNLIPSGYERERDIIVGHAKGNIGDDHYAEGVDIQRLNHVVTHVWSKVSNERGDSKQTPAAAASVAQGRKPSLAR